MKQIVKFVSYIKYALPDRISVSGGYMMKKYIAAAIFIVVIALLLIAGRKSVITEVVIDSSTGSVWSVLIDTGRYPDWNPFIRRISGAMKPGNVVDITFQPDGLNPITISPVIMKIENGRLLQWEGKLFIPGIFTGRHTFELIPIEKNKTRFIQREEFNGILVPFFNFTSTISGFNAMNRGIKIRAEKYPDR